MDRLKKQQPTISHIFPGPVPPRPWVPLPEDPGRATDTGDPFAPAIAQDLFAMRAAHK